jgi:hypothetical protein
LEFGVRQFFAAFYFSAQALGKRKNKSGEGSPHSKLRNKK